MINSHLFNIIAFWSEIVWYSILHAPSSDTVPNKICGCWHMAVRRDLHLLNERRHR